MREEREKAAQFLEWVENEYHWLLDEPSYSNAVQEASPREVALLGALRGMLIFIPTLEDAVSELVGLAMVSTEEAVKFERAVMSDPDGREVVAKLSRQNPSLFSTLLGHRGRLS